ncbi:helix-turn-helix domain-containing protein [Micromonospora sp. WMMD882]|uniref:helix-turn-helix domain-containing protein n=1 Tax=Micromonospora sp. WMMD882 TaxID=3015151 RepID=UPI00248AEC1E|nr:helix-turn-helix domain-containing protein [Micromonospora sp. WMMD882]WBB78974.1 helix-turn-helix domain-containing protein [Micromonospora sp. WMMD882]
MSRAVEPVSVGELPIGRRVAQWRVRRRMTQQMLADRLGKSKSWVDKVERGVRALDRFSVIEELAGVLSVDPAALLGRPAPPPPTNAAGSAGADGVDAVRAALARYDLGPAGPGRAPAPPVAELGRRVGHAWLTYQHANYPQLLRMLPDLLGDTRRAHAVRSVGAADPLVQAYRITASALVKLGVAELAWLAADRAMTVAATSGDPLLVAVAAIPVGQALRALGQSRPAMAATVTAAHRIRATIPGQGPPDALSVLGTLLLEGALAAAVGNYPRGVRELLDRAAGLAGQVGDGHDHQWTGFGPTAVELARVAAAVDLGDAGEAVARHRAVVDGERWRRLPAERRAAHLVDAARAYLLLGDHAAAGRALTDADRVAPAETRSRPVARTLLTAIVRGGPATPGVTRLAGQLGVA